MRIPKSFVVMLRIPKILCTQCVCQKIFLCIRCVPQGLLFPQLYTRHQNLGAEIFTNRKSPPTPLQLFRVVHSAHLCSRQTLEVLVKPGIHEDTPSPSGWREGKGAAVTAVA